MISIPRPGDYTSCRSVNNMSQTHHLAAILFTDIEGYTAMMQKDEELGITAIRSHNLAVQACAKIHGGTVANFYGDGCLVVFDSATDALQCAINIQHELSITTKIPVRIGLHLGEIFYEEGKVIGDGVNVASRVQSLGIGHSILLSSAFYNNIKNHPEFNTVPMGQFHFKNVNEPMEVFALANDGLRVPKKQQMHGKLKENKNFLTPKNISLILVPFVLLAIIFTMFKGLSDKTGTVNVEKSIAVLSFTDMSTNHDQEHLSDGIAEEILNRLCKFNELKVVARTSSFSFKNKNEDIKTIGRKLNVANILEGSVRINENKIIISVRLTNTENGFTLLSESYADDLQNIFALQSTIAVDIAEKIEAKLSPREKQLLSRKQINPKAYETYLKGRSQFNNGPLNIPGDMFRAKKYFEAAISLDRTFAEAHAYLALTNYNLADWALPAGEIAKIEIALDSAKLLASKALTLDSLNSGAHLAMGSYYFHQFDWIAAENEKRKAVALNPGGTEEKFILASFLGLFGQAEEAIRLDEEAMKLDPLDIDNKIWLARDLYRARKFDECIRQCNQVLQEMPNSSGAYQLLAISYSGKKQFQETGKAWAQMLELNGDKKIAEFYRTLDYMTATRRTLEYFNDSMPKEVLPLLMMSMLYAQLEDMDNTFKFLNLMVEKHIPQISFLSQHQFDFIRNDPRYFALYEKAGFKAYDDYKMRHKSTF